MADLFVPRGTAVISKKGAARLNAGHVWVYESDIESMPMDAPGLVLVQDARGHVFGTALASPRSLIRLRLLTRGREAPTPELLRERLRSALARRRRMFPEADAFRVVHGEADLLPSIFIDKYADCFAVQALSAGASLVLPLLVETLVELATPRAVVIRNDATARQREGLATDIVVAHGSAPVVARYHEGPLLLEANLIADQKTGGFLDQATNHQIAARYAFGEALDCFTYHGGFALQLARVCERVVAVDISDQALARAKANAERNHLTNVSFERADAFEHLPALLRENRRFDTVVIDPPSFASNRASVDKALRAYKEINMRALKLVKPGGVLISCSCSGRVTREMFDEVLREAAVDARRSVQVLEARAAGPDHPILLGVPETDYLKCRIMTVL